MDLLEWRFVEMVVANLGCLPREDSVGEKNSISSPFLLLYRHIILFKLPENM